jgi:hypothetical protein
MHAPECQRHSTLCAHDLAFGCIAGVGLIMGFGAGVGFGPSGFPFGVGAGVGVGVGVGWGEFHHCWIWQLPIIRAAPAYLQCTCAETATLQCRLDGR